MKLFRKGGAVEDLNLVLTKNELYALVNVMAVKDLLANGIADDCGVPIKRLRVDLSNTERTLPEDLLKHILSRMEILDALEWVCRTMHLPMVRPTLKE